jgi:hypothetical protein
METRGRPRRRPHKRHADKGYDYRHLRLALRVSYKRSCDCLNGKSMSCRESSTKEGATRYKRGRDWVSFYGSRCDAIKNGIWKLF